MSHTRGESKESSASVSSNSETEEGSDRKSSASATGGPGPLQTGGTAVGLGASTRGIREVPGIQSKLTVNEPDDKYEKEAERVADAVIRMPEPESEEEPEKSAPSERIQRLCPRCRRRHRQGKTLNCEDCEEELQQVERSAATPEVDPSLALQIRSLRGRGSPLRDNVRSFFEPRFGADFSDVRVHTGTRADVAARAFGARAFTKGTDVAFASGEYAPKTVEGATLLAHELTHVVQQGGTASVDRRPTQDLLQRTLKLGGTEVDTPSGRSLESVQQELVENRLSDIVDNQVGPDPDLNDVEGPTYRADLVRQIVEDLHQPGDVLNYDSMDTLARDVEQRVRTSLLTRKSQGYSKGAGGAAPEEGRKVGGFAYPNTEVNGVDTGDPQVNEAATQYWDGPDYSIGNYRFTLTPEGRNNAFEAIDALFTPQEDPRDRTLIHCDYLLSVVEYRAWAKSIGVDRFNEAVAMGEFEPVLKWNGFDDTDHGPNRPNEGLTESYDIPEESGGGTETDTPLQEVTVSGESELQVGDHVKFFNHDTYDALTEGVEADWRLENAIVIDKRGGTVRYQGHGFYSPVTKEQMLADMIEEYNMHVEQARENPSNYDGVKRVGGTLRIQADGRCRSGYDVELEKLDTSDAPGLKNPCESGEIRVRRPQHTN